MNLRVLDLFSGIGGFSLGLERTGGFRTVAFCEIETYCRRVLAEQWPRTRIFEDIRLLRSRDIGAVEVICGGFPCQDISTSGKGAGLDGARSGLWGEYRRLIEECRPRWAIIENVSVLRSRGLDQVLGQLAAIGYDAEWHCIPAAAVGAPHQRDRVWIVAYPAFGSDQPRLAESIQWAIQEGPTKARYRKAWTPEPGMGRVVDGVPHRVDRLRALGNAVIPQIPEIIGRAILQAEGLT